VPPPPFSKPNEIIGVAGGGPTAVLTSGIPALEAALSNPGGVAVDSSGDVFIADTDNNEVREVTPDGIITTIAGNGFAGKRGNGGSATLAELDHPEGVAVDSSGDVYIADTGNNEVRVVAAGVISDFAGNGTAGESGNGGKPTSAELDAPYGVAVSLSGGDVAIADTNSNIVRLVYKQRTGGGISRDPSVLRPSIIFPFTWEITTIAGGGTSYGDGGLGTNASLSEPTGVSFDAAAQNVLIADTGDSAIREVSLSSGDISTAAYSPYPTSVAIDAGGDLFIADPEQNVVLQQLSGGGSPTRFAGYVLPGASGDGGPARAARLDYPSGLALDPYGDLFIADTSNSLIREVVAARAPLFVAETAPLDAGAHQPYQYLFVATGVPQPTFSLAAGAPSWLSISATTGLVKGTLPSSVRTFTYSVVATNPSGTATAGPFTVSVAEPFVYTGKALAVLSAPVGVAEEPNGDVLVTDAGKNRVDGFKANGQFIGAFGSAGTGNGQFEVPTGVAVDAAGDIFVVDSGNNRIEKFTATGVFIESFGAHGTLNGQFHTPSGITVGPNGFLYVADSGNDRIEVFTTGGLFLGKFGSAGTGHGELRNPQGLAVTADGILLVADSDNNRIEGFLESGQYFAQFGSVGSALGDFNRPVGVAVDPAGNIFVSDRVNNRVEMFSSAGEPVLQFGATGAAGERLEQPEGLAVSQSDVVTVADPSEKEILQFTEEAKPVFTADSPALATVPGATYSYFFGASAVPTATYTLTGAPAWLSIDLPSGDLSGTVPSDTTSFSYSVVATNSIGSTTAGPFTVTVVVAGGYILQFGSYGTGNGEFDGIGQSATAADGDLYVVDRLNNRIEVFTSSGQYLSQFGTEGSGNGQLNAPVGIAFTSGGEIWVSDYGNDRMEEFSSQGTYLTQFGAAGTAAGDFENPEGIAVDQTTNDVYVADTSNNRVQEFSAAGAFIREFTTTSEGVLSTPTGVAVTSAGEVYIGNDLTAEIVGFNAAGTQNATIAGPGSGPGEFFGFAGIAVDSAGNIWASDYPNNRIEEFSRGGTFLVQFGSEGSGNAQFIDPGELSVSPDGVVSVADTGNDRVEQFAEPPA
jgi:DNA-binding beta-propeller fold protein YncE